MARSADRYAIVDAVRGFAIWLMFVYHLSWDLTYFRFTDFDVATNPYWVWFARFIAGIMLFVVGVSQALASNKPRPVKVILKRVTLIGACALTVSAGTYVLDPSTFIFFGILHHITLTALVMPIIVRLPDPMIVIMSAACLSAPLIFTHNVFFSPWLWWVGLAPTSPPALDHVPLLPWLGVSLAGLLAGRWVTQLDHSIFPLSWRPRGVAGIALRVAGRHSLLIYMVHQPILYGCVYLARVIVNS